MPDTSGYFDAVFRNAKLNAILIMSNDGFIQDVNEAFTTAFGYTKEDLESKNHRLLFIEKDRVLLKPEIELNQTHREGSSSDENYLLHKDGTPVWVSGESILANASDGTYIIKVIHNIHAQKQLERYLLTSTELLDALFNSVYAGLLLLDSRMRTVKCNAPFLKMFGVDKMVAEGSKLQDIPHPFWSEDEIKNDVRNALVKGEKIAREYVIGNEKSQFLKIQVTSKVIVGDDSFGKKLLLVLKQL